MIGRSSTQTQSDMEDVQDLGISNEDAQDVDVEREEDDAIEHVDEPGESQNNDVNGSNDSELDAAGRIRLALQQLQELQESGDDQSESFLRVQAKLAQALFDDGKHQQALGCQRKLLQQSILPRETEFICEAHTSLALMLGELEQHNEALKILKENVKVYEKIGEGLPIVLIQAIAWNMSILGGEERLDAAHDILTQALKDDDELSDSSRHNMRVILANVFNKMGNHSKEFELRQKILDSSTAIFGEDSPLVKDNKRQLADARAHVLQEKRLRAIFKLVFIVLIVVVAWYYAQ